MGRSLQFFQCLVMISLESIRVSSQELSVSSTDHTVRVVGHGYFTRSCKYRGNSADFLRLKIHLNGTVLPRGGRGRDRYDYIDNVNYVDVRIRGLTYADSGNYTCSAFFSGGIAVRSVSAGSLRVYSTDSISHNPPVVNVVEGGNALLECSTSIPQTYAVWTYSNFVSDFTGVVSNVGLRDARQYGCTIIEESTDRFIYTGLIKIEVVVPPKITTGPQVSDIYGIEMENFTVSFLSSRSFTEIIWLKDSVPIHTGFETHYQNSTAGTTSLVFDPLTRADEGLYTVRISNNNTLIPTGRRLVTYNFRVNVEVPPDRDVSPSLQYSIPPTAVPGQPHSIKLISVSSTSLTIQAQLSDIGTAPILSAHLSITSPDSTSSLHDVTENLFQGKVLEFVVDGLSSNTTYFVVIYAVNAVGKGQESERMNFTTTATSSSSITGAVIGGISGGLVAVTVLLFVVIVGCCWYHRRKRTRTTSHKRTSRPSEGELRQKRTSIGDWSSKEGGVSLKGEMPSKRDWASKGSSKGEDWPSTKGGDGPSKGSPEEGDWPSKGSSKGDWPSKRGSVSSEGPFKKGQTHRSSKGGDGKGSPEGDWPSKGSSKGDWPSKRRVPLERGSVSSEGPFKTHRSSKGGDGPSKGSPEEGDWPSKGSSKGGGVISKGALKGDRPPNYSSKGGDGQGDRPSKECR